MTFKQALEVEWTSRDSEIGTADWDRCLADLCIGIPRSHGRHQSICIPLAQRIVSDHNAVLATRTARQAKP